MGAATYHGAHQSLPVEDPYDREYPSHSKESSSKSGSPRQFRCAARPRQLELLACVCCHLGWASRHPLLPLPAPSPRLDKAQWPGIVLACVVLGLLTQAIMHKCDARPCCAA